jgi:alpha-D-ribose 1-methylphosphonate 5-triphosphate synthase subunit PhnL
MAKKALELNGLEKNFTLRILNDKFIAALHNINLSIDQGEVVGLIGKSGSGKSTLMKCIYRTYLPSAGAIWYHSALAGPIDLAKAGDHEILHLRKQEITYCSQFLSVIPRVSALEVVASGLYGRNNLSGVSPLDLAADYLDRIELPKELWDAYPSTFSGGEQQRVNVARAIISNPRLLLIDEPTASLDHKTKNVVIDMILELKEKGTTVLVISHDSYTLERMCDRMVELQQGTIITPLISV